MARLYVLFAAVYLLEGVTEVPFILNVYLSKVMQFTPSQVAQTLFLGGIWFILLKPVLGFVADFWRRFSTRVALSLGVLCSAGGWLLIARAQTQAAMIAGVSLKVVAIALLDVLIDGMIVSVSHAKNRSLIQSIVYAARFGGGMFCANWAGGMITESTAAFTQIYYVFSVASLVVLLPVFLYRKRFVEAGKAATLPPEDQIGIVQRFAINHDVGFGLSRDALQPLNLRRRPVARSKHLLQRPIDTLFIRHQRIASGNVADEAHDVRGDLLVGQVVPRRRHLYFAEPGLIERDGQFAELLAGQVARTRQHGEQRRDVVAMRFDVLAERL